MKKKGLSLKVLKHSDNAVHGLLPEYFIIWLFLQNAAAVVTKHKEPKLSPREQLPQNVVLLAVFQCQLYENYNMADGVT